MRLTLTAFLVSLFIFSCSPSTTFYVVRHAEKAAPAAGTDTRDPQLSEAGKQRAAMLAAELSGKKIRHIFVTNTIRSKSTAEPTASAFHLPMELYPPLPDSVFIKKLRSLKGNTLIVGHSNTVDNIVNQLTGQVNVPGDLAETSYDRLYMVTLKKKRSAFRQKRYGATTP
ncbi:MAG: histidine phosphatase family protein [Chitinophagaceae bacterium]|nr:MAG: histidine phosphatase family protein [Chitinophagaceae bacterium]